MAVKISTRGRYALRLMLDLALHDTGEYISLRDISARQGDLGQIPRTDRHGARPGGACAQRARPQGGYRLSKAPADYTAGEILRTIEGSLAPVACLDDSPNACARAGECATLVLWERLSRAINETVDGMTLADLAEIQRAKAGNDYVI